MFKRGPSRRRRRTSLWIARRPPDVLEAEISCVGCRNHRVCVHISQAQSWSWDMSPKERWASAAVLLKGMSCMAKELRATAEGQLETARQGKAEAAAAAFKSARVIGATVAGAAKRFKGLRAAEPFRLRFQPAAQDVATTPLAFFLTADVRQSLTDA